MAVGEAAADAGHLLSGWADALEGLQAEAEMLRAAAEQTLDDLDLAGLAVQEAAANHDRARAALRRVRMSGGEDGPDPSAVRPAWSRLEAASSTQAHAERRLEELTGRLGDIRAEARALLDRHQAAAAMVASALRDARPEPAALPTFMLRLTSTTVPPGVGALTNGDGRLDATELELLRRALAGGRPAVIHDALSAMSPAELQTALSTLTEQLAWTDGVPQHIRVAANRVVMESHLEVLAAEMATLDPNLLHDVWDELVDSFRPEEYLGAGAAGFVTGPRIAHTDTEKLAKLQARMERIRRWLDDEPQRQIIAFVLPADVVNGDGAVVEVFGDLDTAAHIGVLVPGIWNHPDNYDEVFRPSVTTLLSGVSEDTALVAYLGYDAPSGLLHHATVTADEAERGAVAAAAFIDGRGASGQDPHVTLIGHSYGSRTAAETAQLTEGVHDLVLLGSPGVGVATAAELGVDPEHVWVGRNDHDEIRFVPPVQLGPLGHGRDPTDTAFGGNLLHAGPGRHPHYFDPGRGIGASVAHLIEGEYDEADVAAVRGPGERPEAHPGSLPGVPAIPWVTVPADPTDGADPWLPSVGIPDGLPVYLPPWTS